MDDILCSWAEIRLVDVLKEGAFLILFTPATAHFNHQGASLASSLLSGLRAVGCLFSGEETVQGPFT